MPQKQLQLEGPNVSALLERIAAELGPSATIESVERVRRGGIAGFFAREELVATVTPPEPQPRPAGGQAPAPSLSELADSTRDVIDISSTFDFATALRAATAASDALVGCPPQEALPEPPQQALSEAPEEELPEPAVPAPSDGAPLPGEGPAKAPPTDGLLALGFPSALLLPASAPMAAGALARALESLDQPPALPALGGSVLVVVGDGPRAVRTAAALARRMGLDPSATTVAAAGDAPCDAPAWLLVDSPQAALERRMSWRRRPVPVVVAVCASPDDGPSAWARDVLSALEPAAVWGAVEAARKPADIAAWAASLGGLDALALECTQASTTPAEVLACGVPVGMIDGAPATPQRWAELLLERLEERAHRLQAESAA